MSKSTDLLELTLLAPGLLGPFPEMIEGDEAIPEAPALARLLGRGRSAGPRSESYLAAAFSAFGLSRPAGDWPVAAVTRLADTGEQDEGWWLRADPVFLKAETDHAILFGSYAVKPTAEEAEALAGLFNQHFAADGLRLEAPVPDRWYLRLAEDPGITTHPVSDVVRRSVKPFLPEGEAAGCWHSLLTEIQMLFHTAGVNEARRGRGAMPINSLWFWGGGRLPQTGECPWESVAADAALVRGLARLGGREPAALPEDGEAWLAEHATGHHLVGIDTAETGRVYGDPDQWHDAVADIERRWIAPLREGLKNGSLHALTLDAGEGGRLRLRRRDLWKLWKRPRGLERYL